MAIMASTIKKWMVTHKDDYRDECGEVQCTPLAEAAAGAFDLDGQGGPLDDSSHPIWDWAAQVAIADES